METSKRLLATANRILAQEGVLDAFGHASLRDPADASRFILSRSLAPELVTKEDILAFDLMSQPISPTDTPLYSERVIHGAIYRARPDVMAICHHHAPPLLPFCLADLKLRVVTQLGATIGKQVPVWDQRDEFGATNHLVVREDEAVLGTLPWAAFDRADEAARRDSGRLDDRATDVPVDIQLPRRRVTTARLDLRRYRFVQRRGNRRGVPLSPGDAFARLGILEFAARRHAIPLSAKLSLLLSYRLVVPH